MTRKGQIRWLAKGDVLGQRRFIHTLFGMTAENSGISTLAYSLRTLFATHPWIVFALKSAPDQLCEPILNTC